MEISAQCFRAVDAAMAVMDVFFGHILFCVDQPHDDRRLTMQRPAVGNRTDDPPAGFQPFLGAGKDLGWFIHMFQNVTQKNYVIDRFTVPRLKQALMDGQLREFLTQDLGKLGGAFQNLSVIACPDQLRCHGAFGRAHFENSVIAGHEALKYQKTVPNGRKRGWFFIPAVLCDIGNALQLFVCKTQNSILYEQAIS